MLVTGMETDVFSIAVQTWPLAANLQGWVLARTGRDCSSRNRLDSSWQTGAATTWDANRPSSRIHASQPWLKRGRAAVRYGRCLSGGSCQ